MIKKTPGARLLLVLAVAFILIPGAGLAAELRTGDQPGTSGTERITEDLYVAGGNVLSSGTIIGDLAVVGGNVTVNGTVSTDLMVVGGSVTVLGNVQDDLRVAGGNVTVNGTVDGDLVVAGGNLQLAGKRVGGDVLAGGGSVRLDTPVAKDVRIAGGQVTINAPVAGNVEVDAQQLTLGASAVIGGNLTYRSATEMKMEAGASVKGKTTYVPLPQVDEAAVKGAAAAFFSLWMLMKLLGTLACTLILGLIFRRYSRTLVATVRANPLSELGRGFVALIVWPVLSVILIVTVLAAPFGIIALLAYVAAMIFASLVAPLVLGSVLYRWISKSETDDVSWKTIVVGVLASFVLGLIPVIGWIANFILFLFALGAMLKIKRDIVKEWR